MRKREIWVREIDNGSKRMRPWEREDIMWMRRTRKTLPPSLKLKLFFIEMPSWNCFYAKYFPDVSIGLRMFAREGFVRVKIMLKNNILSPGMSDETSYCLSFISKNSTFLYMHIATDIFRNESLYYVTQFFYGFS